MSSDIALHPFELLLQMDKRNREQHAAAPPQPGGGVGRLAVRMGKWNLLFAMDEVTEIIPVPRITLVPGMKGWLLGIANLRGAVMAVVDLLNFLREPGAVLTPGSRLLVVQSGEWSYGLLMDEILGMRQGGLTRQPAPAERIPAALHPYITDFFISEDVLWLCFSVGRLLDDANFLQGVA